MATETPQELAQRRIVEWSTYVANGPIHIDNVLAFNTNSPVPVSTVVSLGLLESGQVRKADAPAPDPETDVTPPPVGDPIILNAETTPPTDLTLPDPAVDAPADKK